MKHIVALFISVLPLLSSCDHIDAVGDKVNDLKDLRKETTQGIDGMKLGQILDGMKDDPTIRSVGPTEYDTFIADPTRLNIVNFKADWSESSKKFELVLAEVVAANEMVSRLGHVDVDKARVLAQAQQVTQVPDVRFYVNGHLVHHFTGNESRETLEKIIRTHSSSIVPISNSISQGGNDESSSVPRPAPAANVKPIEKAMTPMKKDWLPPGVSQKK